MPCLVSLTGKDDDSQSLSWATWATHELTRHRSNRSGGGSVPIVRKKHRQKLMPTEGRGTFNSRVRVPEILSDLVLGGRNSSLLPSLLGKRGGRREEDAGNAETPRNRNLAQGRASENGSGSFGGGVCAIGPSYRGRESGCRC